MRRDPEEFGDEELELVHVARKLREARAVESVLTDAALDYAVVPEPYAARFLFVFPTQRVGAFFYVRTADAPAARARLADRGFRTFEADPATS